MKEMKVDSNARGGGKTTRMAFAMLQQPNAVMVVHSHTERQRLIGEYPDLERRVFTFDDFPTRSRGVVRPDTPVFVDNADIFLRRMLGNVTYISLTAEEGEMALTDAQIARQRQERIRKNGRTPMLGTGRVRARVTEMRSTLGRLERQCTLMDQECDALDIAIDNGVFITDAERACCTARSVAEHYRLQYEGMRASLAAAEERTKRLTDALDAIEGIAHPPGCTEQGIHDIWTIALLALAATPATPPARGGM